MSTIPSGLRADIMRKHMEDKNTLQTKGSLYVGTGVHETISATDPMGTTQNYDIQITTSLDIPQDKLTGSLLITDSTTNSGLTWGNSVSSFTATSLNSTTFTNNGLLTNSGNIINGGDLTNSGNVYIKDGDTTKITLTNTTGNINLAGGITANGDVQAATFNSKTIKVNAAMETNDWTSDAVIPTANAITNKIADIVAAGETLINGQRGSFWLYTPSDVSIDGDVVATITTNPSTGRHAIALSIAGVEVNTWSDPVQNPGQAEQPGE